MAVAKKRKGVSRKTGSSRAKVKKMFAKAAAQSGEDPRMKPWATKLHSSRLMYLRNDPDFHAMVKIGRVVNSITFCITDTLTYDDLENRTHRRQSRRAEIMLGGFLHEAIAVVDSIKGPYLGVAEFEPLRLLILDRQYEKIRKQAKKVRNYMAFHLDRYDATTRETIENLKPATYTLWCGEDRSNGANYFEFADFLDMSFLGNAFPPEDGSPPDEAGEKIMISLVDYAMQFVDACYLFNRFLWETKIEEHTY